MQQEASNEQIQSKGTPEVGVPFTLSFQRFVNQCFAQVLSVGNVVGGHTAGDGAGHTLDASAMAGMVGSDMADATGRLQELARESLRNADAGGAADSPGFDVEPVLAGLSSVGDDAMATRRTVIKSAEEIATEVRKHFEAAIVVAERSLLESVWNAGVQGRAVSEHAGWLDDRLEDWSGQNGLAPSDWVPPANAGQEHGELQVGVAALRVEARKGGAILARFIEDLRGKPQLRLLQLSGNQHEGNIEILLRLREPVSVLAILSEMETVSEAVPSDEPVASADTAFVVQLAAG